MDVSQPTCHQPTLFFGPFYAPSTPESIQNTSMDGRVSDLLSKLKVKI